LTFVFLKNLAISQMDKAKQLCLAALKSFIEDSSNENKMELIIEYDEIDDQDKAAFLGAELNAAIASIVLDNHHPDEFLEILRTKFFS
jgi:hypothetical protein